MCWQKALAGPDFGLARHERIFLQECVSAGLDLQHQAYSMHMCLGKACPAEYVAAAEVPRMSRCLQEAHRRA